MSLTRGTFAGHRVDLGESRITKLLALVAAEPRGRLLDVGCAAGELASVFASDGWQVVGLEREATLVDVARARGIATHQVELDQEAFPLADRSIDVAVAGEVIEHLVDTDHLLRELARVLRPGGALVVTTPNLASLENRLRLMVGRYPMWMDHGIEGTGHLRYYTPRVLRAQLARHGFRVERHVGNWVPVVPQRWLDDRRMPWLAITGDWCPSLAMDIIVKARR